MRRWSFSLDLGTAKSAEPLFVRIAQAISRDIRRGRLKPGSRLPGERTLSATLGVDRGTVTAAYRELLAQGWIELRPSRGAFVSGELPAEMPRGAERSRPARPQAPAYRLAPPKEPALSPGPWQRYDLSRSAPDPREFPVAEYARALRRQLRRNAVELLGYGDARGHGRLRAAIAAMLAERRGLAATADQVLVTRGSQMALDLIARTLIAPGDTVALEDPGYPSAWRAFEGAGARLAWLGVDENGADMGALEALLATKRVRAVHVTPHHQYPTTVTLAPARRLALLDLARRHGFAIVEDDYDHEFHYDGRPILPVAASDVAGSVIYVGTLSKTLAPTLRLGYVVAPVQVIEALAEVRQRVDRQGDLAVEAAVADMVESGLVQRHVWRVQRLTRARRDALCEAIAARLGHVLEVKRPSGGMAAWARVAPDVDVEVWARRCRSRDVFLQTARKFSPNDAPLPYLRLNYAALRENELVEAVRRMALAL